MENASKALLIAGSVLIVILLIAVGVRVFNSTQGTTDSVETTMNATEVAIFNNKFMKYVGTNKSKSQVMSLVNEVISSNSTIESHQVSIQCKGDINVTYSSKYELQQLSHNCAQYLENGNIIDYDIDPDTGYITKFIVTVKTNL